jgi:hypothetical protein
LAIAVQNEVRVRSETRFCVVREVLALARCDWRASPDPPSTMIGTVAADAVERRVKVRRAILRFARLSEVLHRVLAIVTFLEAL